MSLPLPLNPEADLQKMSTSGYEEDFLAGSASAGTSGPVSPLIPNPNGAGGGASYDDEYAYGYDGYAGSMRHRKHRGRTAQEISSAANNTAEAMKRLREESKRSRAAAGSGGGTTTQTPRDPPSLLGNRGGGAAEGLPSAAPKSGGAAYYKGPHAVIVNRPRTFKDRILYRYRKQPLLKGYALFLILVELLVLHDFLVKRLPAFVACSWLTRGYPTGDSTAASVYSTTPTPSSLAILEQLRTPIGDALFASQFMCLIITRVLFYLYYENIAIAGLAAFVHTGEILHFWRLGAIKTRVDGLPWAFDQYLVYGFVLVNSPIFISHFIKVFRYYYNYSRRPAFVPAWLGLVVGRALGYTAKSNSAADERAQFEAWAASSTESLTAATERREKRRRNKMKKRQGSNTAVPYDSPCSPTELTTREFRPLRPAAFRRIKRIRALNKFVGAVGLNLVAAFANAEVAYQAMTMAVMPPSRIDPFAYRSLSSEDSSQGVLSVSVFLTVASLFSALVPLVFAKTSGSVGTMASIPAEGRYSKETYFSDSEDDEWFVSTPAPTASVVAARFPVALLGVLAQLLIAVPMRNAAITEYYENQHNHSWGNNSPLGGIGSATSAASMVVLLGPAILSALNIIYAATYTVVMLSASGVLTKFWVRILDQLL